jgi:hypothetical protein
VIASKKTDRSFVLFLSVTFEVIENVQQTLFLHTLVVVSLVLQSKNMFSFDSEDQPDLTLSWIKFESIPSAATAAVATFAPHKFMDLTTIDHSLGHSRGFKMMSIFISPRTSALPGSAVLNSETGESVRFSLMVTCHAAFSPDGSLFVSQYRDGVFSTAVMSENMDNPVYTGIDSKDEERSFFSKRPSNWRYTFSENNQWLASQKEEGAVVL